MAQLFKNNAFSALAASLTNVATTLTVSTGHGDRFPAVSGSDFFMLTLQDASNNVEIVKVTARTAGADAMTIVRAQEGFTARAWNMGDVVELRVTSFALNPLSVFAGAATAQAMRDAMDTPSRTGGDASGTWAISISGNAATATSAASASAAPWTGITGKPTTRDGYGITDVPKTDGTGASGTWSISISGNAGSVTNGVYTTGNQTIGGNKSFTGNTAFGGTNTPATTVDVQTTGANTLTSLFTTGLSDLNFRIGAMNGAAGSTDTTQGKFGLFYLGVGETATIDFRRGGSTTDGSIAFRTSGTDRATLDNSGNFTASGNVTAYSDERLKKDWQDLPADFIERMAFVKHGTYTRKDTGERQAGASAQDMQRLLAEFVGEGPDGFLSLAYGNAALVAAIQLSMRVVDLEARLKALEAN